MNKEAAKGNKNTQKKVVNDCNPLNKAFVHLKCLNHQKKVTIVWVGNPIMECPDEKCVNATIKLFWKTQRKKMKKHKKHQQFKWTKRKINRIFESEDVDYDGYIAMELIDLLLKLKILRKQITSLQFYPLLKICTKNKAKLNSILDYIVNTLDAKFMNCCRECRFQNNKKVIFDKKQKNEIIKIIMNDIFKNQKHETPNTFSNQLIISLKKYNILIDAKRFESIILEKEQMSDLRRFNYLSLSIASILSLSSLIITILQLITK